MQVIRLARVGRNKYPVYRIVTADKRRAANGKFVQVIGRYNPHTKELVIEKEALQTAITNGAQPSNAVLKLMKAEGLTLPKWAEIKTRNRKPKKEVEAPSEAPTEQPAKAESTEADATETKPDVEVVTEETEAAEAKATPKEASETPAEAKKAKEAKKTEAKVADVAVEEAKKEAAEGEAETAS